MKKFMMVFTLALTALLLVGCGGGKKLVCTMQQKQNAGQYYIDLNSEIIMGLNGDDNVTSMEMNVEVVIPEAAYDEMKQQGDINASMEYLAEMFMQGFVSSVPEEYAKTDYKINKNKITVNSKVDMSEAKEERNKQDAIDYFEGNGYTCK